jgi:hypothetical protein
MALRTPKISLIVGWLRRPVRDVRSKATRQRRCDSCKPLVFIRLSRMLHNGRSVYARLTRRDDSRWRSELLTDEKPAHNSTGHGGPVD